MRGGIRGWERLLPVRAEMESGYEAWTGIWRLYAESENFKYNN